MCSRLKDYFYDWYDYVYPKEEKQEEPDKITVIGNTSLDDIEKLRKQRMLKIEEQLKNNIRTKVENPKVYVKRDRNGLSEKQSKKWSNAYYDISKNLEAKEGFGSSIIHVNNVVSNVKTHYDTDSDIASEDDSLKTSSEISDD